MKHQDLFRLFRYLWIFVPQVVVSTSDTTILCTSFGNFYYRVIEEPRFIVDREESFSMPLPVPLSITPQR
jgi:hypothetical protein